MHSIIKKDCENILKDIKGDLHKLEGKTLLLTGFSGFIGTYISCVVILANKTFFKNNQCKLIGLDNFSRGKPGWVSEIENNLNVDVINHDITRPLPDRLGSEKINFIIHAASIASPTFYRQYPIETMDANVEGLRNLLRYSVKNKNELKSLLFFSTSEIYGDPPPENIPTPETYNGNVSCTGPRACYDESKRYGETLCVNYFREHNVPIKIVRPFNNYGPGLKIDDRRVVPDFFKNILNGKDITIFSDGSPTRTFCYIGDAIVGYFKILLSDYNGEVFNMGADKPEISVSELARKIVEISKNVLGIEAEVKYQKSNDPEYLTDSPQRRCPDISKAKKFLQFYPSTSLDDGLRKTALWYKDTIDKEHK